MKNLDIILDLLSYEGSTTNDPVDAIKVKNKSQETEITSITRQEFQVADGTTALSIVLPDADSDYLVILTDREISINLNGWATALTLKPRAIGKKTWVYYTKGSITGLTVSNASGGTANIDIILANK